MEAFLNYFSVYLVRQSGEANTFFLFLQTQNNPEYMRAGAKIHFSSSAQKMHSCRSTNDSAGLRGTENAIDSILLIN